MSGFIGRKISSDEAKLLYALDPGTYNRDWTIVVANETKGARVWWVYVDGPFWAREDHYALIDKEPVL